MAHYRAGYSYNGYGYGYGYGYGHYYDDKSQTPQSRAASGSAGPAHVPNLEHQAAAAPSAAAEEGEQA